MQIRKYRENKKILYIVNVDWFFISHRLPIAIKAIEKGYEVHVATAITGCENILKDNGIILHKIELERSSINPFKNLFTTIEMVSVIKSVGPNILHLVTIKPIIMGGIASIFCNLIFSIETSIVASITGVGYPFTSKARRANYLKILISIFYKISLSNRNKYVIFQNKDDLKLISSLVRIKSEESILIPGSGVNLLEFKYSPIPTGIPIIMFPARILKSKGIYEFVEASKYVLNSRFVVVGKLDYNNRDCISKKVLNKWINEGLIEYWGYSKYMFKKIQQATIVVLPSYKEGLPKVLIEAAASGRPVVTTDVTGCRDAITNNKTGLLVPLKDYKSLSKAITFLLDNPKILKQMGIEGRALAERKYDINHVIKKHLEIYDELILR